jgi:hypothetical protein
MESKAVCPFVVRVLGPSLGGAIERRRSEVSDSLAIDDSACIQLHP